MRFRNLIVILGMGLTLMACADLFTINRVTEIPNKISFKKDPDRYYKKQGKAIHLDAQQRLVLVTAQGYCAEPSPDALASYAAALGFDLNVFDQNSRSLAQALQSDSSSIGLRTHSVTLMRDSLYRMCEASNNGRLNDTEVAAFLRRSQDLTAVILAIEQLTGAVAANQVILNSSAAANLVSNHQLLEQMEKDVRKKEKVVEEKKAAVETARLNVQQFENQNPQNSHKISEAKKQWETTNTELKAAQERLKKTQAVRDEIESSRDSALTNTATETTGTGQFSPIVQRNQLNEKATESVAKAVENMVKHVLNKSYTPDVCLSHLLRSQDKIEDKIAKTRDFISKLRKNKTFPHLSTNIRSLLDIQTVLGTMRSKFNGGTTKKQEQAIKEIEQHVKKIRNIQEIKAICMDLVKASIQPNIRPNAPIGLTATPGNRIVRLTWTTPDDGGAAIRSYEYQKSSDEGKTWSLDWTSIPGSGENTTNYTITNLTNGTQYTFKVRAKNLAGAGKASESASAIPKIGEMDKSKAHEEGS